MKSERAVKKSGVGFILHTVPWKETSLLVEVLTREGGRIALMAKGARRPRSPVRGVLRAFQPLELEWTGLQELRTLVSADWGPWQPLLRGESLYCGLYLNELVLKLLARDDPHPELFDGYEATLHRLAHADADREVTLRRFELLLLREIGYGPELCREVATGRAVEPGKNYRYDPTAGPILASPREDAVQFSGEALLGMARDDWRHPQTALQAKSLMRLVLAHHLGHQRLHSRSLFKEISLP